MNHDDDSAILRKADALMSRHRSTTGILEQAITASIDDGLPVLTEIVTAESFQLATAPAHMQQQLETLREELARWLNEELPHAVLKVTDGLADQLMAELTHQAEQHLLPRLIARLDGSATSEKTAEKIPSD